MTPQAKALAGGAAAAVLVVGVLELSQFGLSPYTSLAGLVFLVLVAVAVGLARWAPAAALGLAWLAGITQVAAGLPILLVEGSLVVVLFAAARWGRGSVMATAGLSVAVVPILGLGWFLVGGVQPGLGWGLPYKLLGLAAAGGREGRLVMLGLGTLGVPYLAGLTLRYFARAEAAQQARQTAETDARAAQEIARLQEEQNRLARDVHDVVGHSLTVILAQAESAQYIDDPDRLKQTMKTIATSARASLQDVRQVLTPGQQHTVGRGGLDELIEAVQASGHRVVATAVGTVRPLPPELDAVAYRVLQEMLTNAIKHGRRDEPIVIERHWPDRDGAGALRIVVRNTVDADARTPAGSAESGQGLVGMQRRLESVGGRFDVQQREEPHGHTFTATALVPVRSPFAGSPA